MYDMFSEFFDELGGFNMLDAFDIFPKGYTVYKDEKKCPVCGHSFNDFRKTGKLGCGECYNAFRPAMEQTLKQIHRSAVHTGKIPSRSEGALKRERLYADLKKQLTQAVQNEDYEQAAKLHKQIKEMESDMQ